MSFIATAVVAASSIYSGLEQKKQAKKAKKQALEDAKQARRAEVFAETEGEGVGSLGQISLAVDDEEEDEELRLGKSNVRI